MATSALSTPICTKSPFSNSNFKTAFCNVNLGRQGLAFYPTHDSCRRPSYVNQLRERDHRSTLKPVSAVGSGVELTLLEPEEEEGTLSIKRASIVVESQEADKMKLRVFLSGEQTKKAFRKLVSRLACSVWMYPAFRRRRRSGKVTKVPKDLVVKKLGKDLIVKSTMQNIIASSVENFVRRKNLKVKGNKLTTIQTEDELNESFLPGNEFLFNVEFELVN